MVGAERRQIDQFEQKSQGLLHEGEAQDLLPCCFEYIRGDIVTLFYLYILYVHGRNVHVSLLLEYTITFLSLVILSPPLPSCCWYFKHQVHLHCTK